MTKRIDRSLLARQIGPLLGLLAELEPTLETDTVLAAVRGAATLPAVQQRIAQEVVDRPELLTGQAAAATLPGVLRLVDALVRAGAITVVAPLCPRCGKQRPLSRSFDGLRLCAGCTRKAVAMPCGRCGRLRPPARRNDNGHPICQACWWRDPRSWESLHELRRAAPRRRDDRGRAGLHPLPAAARARLRHLRAHWSVHHLTRYRPADV